MNQLATRTEQEIAASNQSDTLLAAVIRAASDPAVDVDKMERLMAMAERLEARNARTAYYAEMALMKPELPVINRRGRIEIRAKDNKGERTGDLIQSTGYAYWEDIDEKITPILASHGFSLTFRPGVAQDGKITVTGILTHRGGHSEEATITLPHDSSGSKNPVQAVGSSTSYGKRYAATMLLNIRTKGEDDDGAGTDPDKTIDESQMAEIQGMMDQANADPEKFCKFMGIDALKHMRVIDLGKAREALNHAISERQRKAKGK